MENHFLSKTGLSMSQAQSVSNLCNQYCVEIDNLLENISIVSKEFTYNQEHFKEQAANKIPENLIELLTKKGEYTSLQAFLMENIKLKEFLLDQAGGKCFYFEKKRPESPKFIEPKRLHLRRIADIELSKEDRVDYLIQESFASQIGKFIHKGEKLDLLRKEASKTPLVEWKQIDSNITIPVRNTIHTTPEELFKIHTDLEDIHRGHEQKLNYYKAKIKNQLSDLNLAINKKNSMDYEEAASKYKIELQKYEEELQKYEEEYNKALFIFQEEQEKEVKRIAALRITIPEIFKPLVDTLLKKVVVE